MAELFSLRCILGVGLCFVKNAPANCKMISKTFKQSCGEEQVLNFFVLVSYFNELTPGKLI